ncbi:MAG: hypothetical protein HQL78_06455, partial [Magnetococcales bacterium]|nr:hypothetical protein [Magnetococcales bacterium]
DVSPLADAPELILSNAAGLEDIAIPLNISAQLTDVDGSETLGMTIIENVPQGAVLSAGTDNGNGTWTLTAEDLVGLKITPPHDADGAFDLTVKVASHEGSDTATTVGTLHVDVSPLADAPELIMNNAAGQEDAAIPLNISAQLTDVDGSETLGMTIIENVPNGAVLSAGTDNGDGTWTLTAEDLVGLKITPPHDSDVAFDLTVKATSHDGSDSATTVGTLHVDVSPLADPPELVLSDAAGLEDKAIPLNISAYVTDVDGSETLGMTVIENVPQGAVLSAGTDNGDGTWTLTAEELVGLKITPPHDSDVAFDLTVKVTSLDGSDSATTVGTLHVDVAPVPDPVDVLLPQAVGNEDTAIPLELSFALQDQDGSEKLSGNVVLTDIPQGAVLNIGEAGPGNTWVIPHDALAVTAHNTAGDPIAWEVPHLTITPPHDSDADFAIGVRLVTMDGPRALVTEGTVDVVVHPEADAVTFSIPDAAQHAGGSHHGEEYSARGGSRGGSQGGSRGGSRGREDADHAGLRGRGNDKDHHDHDDKGASEAAKDKAHAGADKAHQEAEQADVAARSAHGQKGSGKDDAHLADARMGHDDHERGNQHQGFAKDDHHGSDHGGNATHREDDTRDHPGEGHDRGHSMHEHGDEHHVVPLGLQINLQDTDGSESLAGGVMITGVPNGAALTLGTLDADGQTWSIGPEHLVPAAFNAAGDAIAWNVPQLGIVLPEDQQPGFALGIQVMTQDGDSTRLTEGMMKVDWDGDHGLKSQEIVGSGHDSLAVHIARVGEGHDGMFDVVIDGETVGRYSVETDGHWHHGGMGTITLDHLNLASDQAHEIRIEPVQAGSHIVVDSISLNGQTMQAESAGQLVGDGDIHEDGVKLNQDSALVFSLPADHEDATPVEATLDQHTTGTEGSDVLQGGAGDDVISGGAGDDILYAGSAGNDQLNGGEGNDLFTVGKHGGGEEKIDGGEGAGWEDEIRLQDVNGGPATPANPGGNWTLETEFNYTVDMEHHQIRFDEVNASGTITLEDGTHIQFDNMELIGW